MTVYHSFAIPNFWNLPKRKDVRPAAASTADSQAACTYLPHVAFLQDPRDSTACPCCPIPYPALRRLGRAALTPSTTSRCLPETGGYTRAKARRLSGGALQGLHTGFQSHHACSYENNWVCLLVIPAWELLNKQWEFNYLEADSASKNTILFFNILSQL